MRSGDKEHTRSISVIVTIAIVGMLVLSNTGGAVTVSIVGLDGSSVDQGDLVTFNVSAKISDSDKYIPLENFSLHITGDTSRNYIFSPDGTVLYGNGISITNIAGPASNQYGYGYGYGYDSNLGTGYDFGYGYGYGYNYGSGAGGDVEYTYTITLDTSAFNSGDHQVTLSLNTGNDAKAHFISSSATFSVESTDGTGGTGSANVVDEEEEEEVEEEEDDSGDQGAGSSDGQGEGEISEGDGTGTAEIEDDEEGTEDGTDEDEEGTGIPGFEALYLVTGIMLVYLFRRH